MTIYKSPQRFGECRICDLCVGVQNKPCEPYEKHHSDWVTGCPIFMFLSTIDKFKKGREAEFCVNCFDKGVKFSGGSHFNTQDKQPVKCSVTKDTKHRYSCLDKTCLTHMWVCRKHKKLNEPTMKKQQTRLKNAGGSLNFNVDSVSPPAVAAQTPVSSIPQYIPSVPPDIHTDEAVTVLPAT